MCVRVYIVWIHIYKQNDRGHNLDRITFLYFVFYSWNILPLFFQMEQTMHWKRLTWNIDSTPLWLMDKLAVLWTAMVFLEVLSWNQIQPAYGQTRKGFCGQQRVCGGPILEPNWTRLWTNQKRVLCRSFLGTKLNPTWTNQKMVLWRSYHGTKLNPKWTNQKKVLWRSYLGTKLNPKFGCLISNVRNMQMTQNGAL